VNEFLFQVYHRLIAETPTHNYRFLYQDLLESSHRLVGIVGSRGVGKTTLLLQYIKNNFYKDNSAFYFSADNAYFNEISILVNLFIRFHKNIFQIMDVRSARVKFLIMQQSLM